MGSPLLDKLSPRRPVVLLGVGGMLHRAWTALLDELGVSHLDPSLDELDLTRPATIDRLIARAYPLVINCAAFTDVDGAETREGLANEINGTGVGHLALACRNAGSTLVHYSTDYVFDGERSEPYAAEADLCPLSAYGRSKALGEVMIASANGPHLIIRTSWMYAPWGKNFVRTIARIARTQPSIRVVNDQFGRPTSAEQLVRASWRLLEQNAAGIFHVCDGGRCSWFDFATEIVRLLGLPCRVEPCTTADYPRPARRPRCSVLDLSKTEQLLGPLTDWHIDLADVLGRLEKD